MGLAFVNMLVFQLITSKSVAKWDRATPPVAAKVACALSLLFWIGVVYFARMTGFTMGDYLERYGEAVQEMGGWLASGKLISREEIAAGLENFPQVLLRLFHGENTGKLVLEV